MTHKDASMLQLSHTLQMPTFRGIYKFHKNQKNLTKICITGSWVAFFTAGIYQAIIYTNFLQCPFINSWIVLFHFPQQYCTRVGSLPWSPSVYKPYLDAIDAPSEELELTTNSLGAHIETDIKLILRTFSYLTVNSQDDSHSHTVSLLCTFCEFATLNS